MAKVGHEQETIIRWGRDADVADLYTSDPREMRRWRELGYPVAVFGTTREGRPSGWRLRVPIAAVALLPLKAGSVRAPKWLEPPTLWEPPENARQSGEPDTSDEIAQEICAEISGADQTPVAQG
jgi:hypothetical protein